MHLDLLDTVLISRTGKPATVVTMCPSEQTMSGAQHDAAAKCPVDPKTREAWLQQARAAQQTSPEKTTPADAQVSALPTPRSPPNYWWKSWISWRRPSIFSSRSPPQHEPSEPTLDTHRAVSSIPRAPFASSPPQSSQHPLPSNHEIETGSSISGHWVYPSEQQFFDALRRKGFTAAQRADMRTVVPIHNAVNERAWTEILQWERPYLHESRSCGGPRLAGFVGLGDGSSSSSKAPSSSEPSTLSTMLSTSVSPRAKVNTLLGYKPPFDRHDWMVERCDSGKTVEYVIDFYAGRGDEEREGKGKINFFLDVRPKLNSWEGVKMRFLRWRWA